MKKEIRNGKIILLVLISILILPAAFASSVTRSFSAATVSPGDTLTVTLDVVVDGGETFYLMDETYPSTSWTATNNGGGDSATNPPHIFWTVLSGATSITYNYQLTVPNEPGVKNFAGTYAFEGMGTAASILGDTQVTISAAGPDTTPPVISGIGAVTTDDSATVIWTTNENSDSKVYYGETALVNQGSNPAMTTSHSIVLNGLSPLTTYNYKVGSCDSSSNCANSTQLIFQTDSSGAPANATDDLMVNYVRGKLLLDGIKATAGKMYKVTVLNGDNAGHIYIGTVDDNIPTHLQGNGYFDTGDQMIFSTNAQFSIDGYGGYTCSGVYTDTFDNGGNGDFNDLVTLITFDCSVVPEINVDPVLNPIGAQTATEDDLFQLTVTATDNNTAEVLTYSTNSSLVQINSASGIISFTPTNNDVGVRDVLVTVTDDQGGSDSEVVTFTIINTNDAPALNAIGDKEANEGKSFSMQLSATDIDPTNDVLTYSTNATFGSLNPSTGLFTYLPPLGTKMTADIMFSVSDGNGGTDEEVITFTVIPTIELSHVQVIVDDVSNMVINNSVLSAKPYSSVVINVPVKNNLNDDDLFGIDVTYEIASLGLSGLEYINHLPAGNTVTKSFDFNLPAIINEGVYELIIEAKDIDEAHTSFGDEIHVFLNVTKKNNTLLIERAEVLQDPMVCLVDAQLNLSIVNTGLFDQNNVNISVVNHNIGVDLNYVVPLIAANTRSNTILNLTPQLLETGEQDLDIKVKYFFIKEENAVATFDIEDCTIGPVIPDPDIPIYIVENGTQDFSIGLPAGVDADWYVDGIFNKTGDEFTYVGNGAQGRFEHDITAVIDGYTSFTWDLTQTSYPITDDFNGDTTDFSTWTEFELRHATNATFEIVGVGKIFLPGPFDVSEIPIFRGPGIDGDILITTGAIGIDTIALPIFGGEPGTITLLQQAYLESPQIMYNSGFTTERDDIKQECDFCTLVDNTPPPTEDGMVEFDVDHFTVFIILTNHAPTITSSPLTKAYKDEEYRYDVNANDQEGDTLTYSLTNNPSGMTINSGTGIISWTPAVLGNFNVSLMVEDGFGGNDTQSYGLEITEAPKLRIREVEADVDGDDDKVDNGDKISEEALPGSEVEFDIEVCNEFSDAADIDIENVQLTVTIEDIDDGDDLEEESDEEDIKADDCERFKLKFNIPLNAEEDEFDVIILAEGEDENNTDHKDEWKITLEVDREKHDLRIIRSDLSPSQVECNRVTILTTKVVNVGEEEEEDVMITIENSALGIDISEEGLEIGENPEDDYFMKSYNLIIGDDIAQGSYPIAVKAYYNSKIGATETTNLVVTDCFETVSEPATTTSTTYLQYAEQRQPENVLVQILPKARPTGRVIAQTVRAPVYKKPVQITSRSCTTGTICNEYTLLLIILVILGAGLLIYFAATIGAMGRRRGSRRRMRRLPAGSVVIEDKNMKRK
ncbi:MAG: putative Ig domain-containing protein [Candidatus Woesearchaeota archaeon]